MKSSNLLLIIIIATLSGAGCQQSTQKSSAPKNNKPKTSTLTSSTTAIIAPDNSQPFKEIVDKDIFTPPDMRVVFQVPTTTIAPEDNTPPEPQKLTITGIMFNGEEYLISVENQETGEINFLKKNDTLAEDTITSLDLKRIYVQGKKRQKQYRVGDQVVLPGTISTINNKRELAMESDTTKGQLSPDDASVLTAPSSGGSLEEMLMKRRQKQEEELK